MAQELAWAVKHLEGQWFDPQLFHSTCWSILGYDAEPWADQKNEFGWIRLVIKSALGAQLGKKSSKY